MNNKYDVGNFSKLIDEYDINKEMKTIKEHLELNLEIESD